MALTIRERETTIIIKHKEGINNTQKKKGNKDKGSITML